MGCITNKEKNKISCQMCTSKGVRLWNILCDLEESFGTLESTKAVYYKMIDIRICTPQTILTFALILYEKMYFEEDYHYLNFLIQNTFGCHTSNILLVDIKNLN